jgi:Arc/MetJ-type ribon-helix-helix transcriptional regulator
MSVDLTPEQEAWLNAHVARGDFPSVADAVRQLIDERIAERMAEAILHGPGPMPMQPGRMLPEATF